ncbi:MAG: hypothetical protein M1482_10090, partial [Chloroflexi bacterium]|nr:hypothetical protein [Chloroflexota bacterium]
MTTVPGTPVIETLDSDASRREFLSKFASGVFAGLVAPALMGGVTNALAAPPTQAPGLAPLP